MAENIDAERATDEADALADLRKAVRDGASDEWILGFIRGYPFARRASASIDEDGLVRDLSMLVRQLAHSLKNAKPDSDLAARAVDYLQRKGLGGSPLRGAAPPLSSEQQSTQGEPNAG